MIKCLLLHTRLILHQDLTLKAWCDCILNLNLPIQPVVDAVRCYKKLLLTHYNKRTLNTLVKAMQTKKAENMMHFLSQKHDALSCLIDDNIVLPLTNLKIKVEERIHPTND